MQNPTCAESGTTEKCNRLGNRGKQSDSLATNSRTNALTDKNTQAGNSVINGESVIRDADTLSSSYPTSFHPMQ